MVYSARKTFEETIKNIAESEPIQDLEKDIIDRLISTAKSAEAHYSDTINRSKGHVAGVNSVVDLGAGGIGWGLTMTVLNTLEKTFEIPLDSELKNLIAISVLTFVTYAMARVKKRVVNRRKLGVSKPPASSK